MHHCQKLEYRKQIHHDEQGEGAACNANIYGKYKQLNACKAWFAVVPALAELLKMTDDGRKTERED